MPGVIARLRHFIERNRLQPDLNRATRGTVAFMVPVLAATVWPTPVDVVYAAITAQNLALVDIRGAYPLRLSLLFAMTGAMAAAAWAGGVAAGSLPWALAVVAAASLLGGVWRRLSPEYGPSLAIGSTFLVLLGLAAPGGLVEASRHCVGALAGGLWAVVVQVALWPFRAEHPLRRAVADSWVALADLAEALGPDPGGTAPPIVAREAALRTTLDQTSAALAAAHAGRVRPHLRELEELNTAAARLATRFVSFRAALEVMEHEADFAALAPRLAPIIVSLGNTSRTVAIVTVSRQPAHLAAAGVRLRRLANLLRALEDQLERHTDRSAAARQLAGILRQIGTVLPEVTRVLRATVDRADERAAFSLELFDIKTWTLRPLASALNFQWRADPALNRFVVRMAVLQMLGVALFKHFGLARGYWLPLTVLVVMQPDFGSTRRRAGQRALGTIVGGVAASVLLWLAPGRGPILAATAATMFAFGFWLKRNYAVAVGFITLFVVLLTEFATRVTIGFTLERLGATLAGVVLALLATLFFWPIWERQLYPGYLARALRANRDYLLLLAGRLAAGGRYDGELVAAKRAAEAANSQVFASLERMYADPRFQQADLAASATLANGNQRISRALTVVALHLRPDVAVAEPAFAAFADVAAETLEALAAAAEAPPGDPARFEDLRARLDQLRLAPAPGDAHRVIEHGAATQFGRCATELSAMLLAGAPEAAPAGPGLPAAAPGG